MALSISAVDARAVDPFTVDHTADPAYLPYSLDSGRFESYLKQKKELQYLARRENRTLQQIEKDKWKKIHASMRERYKIEGKRK